GSGREQGRRGDGIGPSAHSQLPPSGAAVPRTIYPMARQRENEGRLDYNGQDRRALRIRQAFAPSAAAVQGTTNARVSRHVGAVPIQGQCRVSRVQGPPFRSRIQACPLAALIGELV